MKVAGSGSWRRVLSLSRLLELLSGNPTGLKLQRANMIGLVIGLNYLFLLMHQT
jgi:hypothetical protein